MWIYLFQCVTYLILNEKRSGLLSLRTSLSLSLSLSLWIMLQMELFISVSYNYKISCYCPTMTRTRVRAHTHTHTLIYFFLCMIQGGNPRWRSIHERDFFLLYLCKKFIFIINGFRTIVFIVIVISITFRPICPPAFSGVCRTREPSRNFELRPLLSPRGSPVLIPLGITG